MALKRMEVVTKTIGDATFYIKPFGAFTSANLSGELAKMVSPIIGGLAPLISATFSQVGTNPENNAEAEAEGSIMDMEIDSALPAFTNAISTLSGDKIERLMMSLLVDNQNISVCCYATDGNTQILTKDIADEIFCTDIQDMFVLCWEVIKLNFNGFFKKLGGRFGNLQEAVQRMTPSIASGDTST